MREFVGEGLRVLGAAEVAAGVAPFTEATHDTTDQLPNAGLTFGRANMAAKIFRDDHVRRQLRPARGNFAVDLFEEGLALLTADAGGAKFPLDTIEGIVASLGEVTGDRQALGTRFSSSSSGFGFVTPDRLQMTRRLALVARAVAA